MLPFRTSAKLGYLGEPAAALGSIPLKKAGCGRVLVLIH
jgi:hypothetical protein